MPADLDLIALRKTYTRRRKPPVQALQGIDLHVAAGELIGLLGPSGCGKSTTLRTIPGLEEASGGDITLGGRSIIGTPSGKRGVAVAFENYALYPPLDVRGNLRFGLKARGSKDIDHAVGSIAAQLGITSILGEKPAGLSSGDKQRVSLARALIRQPEVLLLDEPLSHLDAAQRERTRRDLKRMQRETGYTTILVTHDQQEAVSMADRVVVMNEGRILQVGTPDEVYDDPATLFVAGFVGTPAMNLLPALLQHDGGHSWIKLSESARLRTDRLQGQDGQDVVLGLRPDDGTLLDHPAESGLTGRLRSAESLLEANQGFVDLPGVDDPLLIQTEPDTPLKPGTDIHLGLTTARTYVFNVDDGARIRSEQHSESCTSR